MVVGVEYDAAGSILGIVLRFKQSVLPNVVNRAEFYMLIGINLGFTFLYKNGFLDPDKNQFAGPQLKALQVLMVFGLVFYTNICFERYFQLYTISRDVVGICSECVSEARLRFKIDADRKKYVSYLVAGVHCFFWLNVLEPDADGAQVMEKKWPILLKKGLLTQVEVDYLKKYPVRCKTYLLYTWAVELCKHSLGEKDLPFLQLNAGHVEQLFKTQDAIQNMIKMPLPFQYFHVTHFMLFTNLSIMGYEMANMQNYYVTISFMAVQVIFNGIREMAVAMADPFGDDEVDFPVEDWLEELYNIAMAMTDSGFLKVAVAEKMDYMPAITEQHCEGLDLAFYESHQHLLLQYRDSRRNVRRAEEGFQLLAPADKASKLASNKALNPAEDLRSKKPQAPIEASKKCFHVTEEIESEDGPNVPVALADDDDDDGGD